MSVLVVGDVHGCYKTLQKLLEDFPSHRICMVGDLIDRGPQSLDVVQFVIDNQDRIKCVRGNHEEMMIRANRNARFGDVSQWLQNGGDIVSEAYEARPELLEPHLQFMEGLPYYIKFEDLKDEEGRYLIVSHSVIIDKDLEYCINNQSIIWGRRFPQGDVSKGEWFNIFGHTPVEAPNLTPWYCNIDTGAVYDGFETTSGGTFQGHLTGMLWPEMEVVMQKNVDR